MTVRATLLNGTSLSTRPIDLAAAARDLLDRRWKTATSARADWSNKTAAEIYAEIDTAFRLIEPAPFEYREYIRVLEGPLRRLGLCI